MNIKMNIKIHFLLALLLLSFPVFAFAQNQTDHEKSIVEQLKQKKSVTQESRSRGVLSEEVAPLNEKYTKSVEREERDWAYIKKDPHESLFEDPCTLVPELPVCS